jgi:predicted AlkP superfamily phosphohydrolase/phosphomutase
MKARVSTYALLALTSIPAYAGTDRMIVIGVDGLDPVMLQTFIAEGKLPNLARLADQGSFQELGTSSPPQSPVAWSDFITGMDSGGHGIFDFIAFDREQLTPFLSTARIDEADWGPVDIGSWRIPLGSQQVRQLRDGVAFWELLEQQGVSTTMFQIPANYPPVDNGGRAISGMGTPDLRGTPGTFTLFTSHPAANIGNVSGGEIIQAKPDDDGVFQLSIHGPDNPFRTDQRATVSDITVIVDAQNPVALVQAGDTSALLNVGEWSGWIPVTFGMVPGLVDVSGMARFYLQGVRPHLSLYVSPINIDPSDAAQTISVPPDYARDLAAAVGRFYTQEMPEDTKALSAGVLSPEEFFDQTALVLEERRHLLNHELTSFRSIERGLIFFYLSSVDQRNHMMGRHIDASHPFHDATASEKLRLSMESTYKEIDEIVGWLLEEVDENTTLIVMSDHGFAPFHKQVNLNTWLERNGYLTMKEGVSRLDSEWLSGIDWANTTAFSIGLNSLYLNVKGRERFGQVRSLERAHIAREIVEKLEAWRDEESGDTIISDAMLREEIYHGPHVTAAPDIVVGYARGYRASWATTTGEVPEELLEDNINEWSGDHCMDARAVPGVILSNRALNDGRFNLRDLTVTVLENFGVRPPDAMSGQSIIRK